MDIEEIKKAARKDITIPKSVSPIDLWIGISSEHGHACGMLDCGHIGMFFHTETNAKICFDHLRGPFGMTDEAIKLHWHKTLGTAQPPKRLRKFNCTLCDSRGYLIAARPTATGSQIKCKACSGTGLIMREVSV